MPELRKDPIVDRWVIIATERGRRPSDFSPEPPPPPASFSPFAYGSEDRTPAEVFEVGRPEGAPANSPGWRVRVVPNKFPALSLDGDLDSQAVGMYDLMNGVGAHEVVIEHPDPAWDMADASRETMLDIFNAYISRYRELSKDPRFRYILIFRNYGTTAGASIAHPHSQLIALPILPKQLRDQLEFARQHFRQKRRSIFEDIVRQEIQTGLRVVEQTSHFVVLCPYASRFPFEVSIYPKHMRHDFTLMTDAEQADLGELLPRTLRRIRNALGNPAYNMMLQTAPITAPRPGSPEYWGTIQEDYCWHIDILPRLTQVAGFEWGTGFYINPVSPESATKFLQDAQT